MLNPNVMCIFLHCICIFLFLMNPPSVSNFNSPSWSKKLKIFLQRPAFVFLSQILNSKFSTDLILLGPFLKKTSYIIQFFHTFLQQIFKHFFEINFFVLAEEIMAAKIAEVMNLFIISGSKLFVGEQSTLSV